MLRFCSLIVLLGLAAPAAADVSGPMRIVDGDSLSIGGVSVRIHGIDAPETSQMCGGDGVPMWACGAWVSGEVRARYEGRHAECRQEAIDRYDRVVAKCRVDGVDLGRTLVRSGLAFAYRKYAMDYDLDEKTAAVLGRGLHAVGVTSPAAYRAATRAGYATQNRQTAPAGCEIKGNISAKGTRIYHMPGQAWYDGTVISASKGERWFCSETEARAAGWRRARR